MFTIGIVLLACLSGAALSVEQSLESSNNSTKTLKLVEVVFSHGQITPLGSYPKDPYVNETFYPYGWRQLTNDGKNDLFELGEWLGQRYGSFLEKLYVPDSIGAQATEHDRTIMSTAALLAGLFPPNNTILEWNDELNWQPIPIISEPLNQDAILLIRQPCPRYSETLQEVFQLPEVKSELDKNQQLFKELTELTGLNITTPNNIKELYSVLNAESEYGLTLPNWTNKYFPHRLERLTEKSFIYNTYTNEQKRLLAGGFIKKIINDWHQKKNKPATPTDLRIYLYGGDDSTVANILSAINVWVQQLPVFGQMAIFELLQDNKSHEYGVQVYMKNKNNHAIPLTIPGCKIFCPLDTFIKLTKSVISINPQAECQAKNQTIKKSSPPKTPQLPKRSK